MSTRPDIATANRIVIKIGTRVLTQTDGPLSLPRLFQIVETAATLRKQQRDVLLVSSGAVGLGRHTLGFSETPTNLAERQACAAVGQGRLMGLYEEGFSQLGIACAQILLTQSDFENRVRYLALRRTLATLLDHGVVPIVNENDVVSTTELEVGDQHVFGDNDRLSALVASKLGADLLVLLTDVRGLLAVDPRQDPTASLISRVSNADDMLAATPGGPGGCGRGGMHSKVESAAMAARAGCHAVIASGLVPGALGRVLAGEDEGTWFPAKEGLSARRRWIAFATRQSGRLHLDKGAVSALIGKGASLLAAGVTDAEGDFREGDVVELVDPDGAVLGRGLVEVDAAAARAWRQGSPPPGVRNRDALVLRDNMVLTEDAP